MSVGSMSVSFIVHLYEQKNRNVRDDLLLTKGATQSYDRRKECSVSFVYGILNSIMANKQEQRILHTLTLSSSQSP